MKESKYPTIYLAPLAGITDAPMRALCREQGAQLAFTEMISAKGIQYKSERTKELLDMNEAEDVVGVQLFGSDAQVLSDTAKWVQDEMGSRLAEINLNMGCPAPKTVNNGEGCALMKTPVLSATRM